MTDSDAVRRVGLALPRAYEREVRGRWKLKVGQIVFVAFSRDEQELGFGFPRAEREGLVAADPETFYLPGRADLRYQWVCAHLARLDETEMRELVVDAWRMCTPAMLHDLPDLPEPAAQVWNLVDRRDWAALRPLLDPSVRFDDARVSLRGRSRVLDHLDASPTPKPPRQVEVRDGRLFRWRR
ncbi:MAG TPA: MmcQ/YjbR family DNA-binding protein [Nocardioides sp.]|uniref:MmcQ/YjbR family DNA-binding protein n=1 Tax=Nocardioides sp. TaxID=35761 RepID=UPI002E31CFA6|nr:MmcQ/YjbR family DNA-binding protein [Nocardioides sp.]HEX3932775.1 MmcQ/YjbR family DNA-binding protein [Nocardioides sp.]